VLRVVSDAVQDIGLTRDEIFAFEQPSTINGATTAAAAGIDAQLNEAVAISQSTPGSGSLYIVSVGYFVAGVPGAIAGWLAMITPALLIIPLVHLVGRSQIHFANGLVIANARLLLAAAIPLAQDALTDPVTIGIAVISVASLLTTKWDSTWIILSAAVFSLSAASLGLLTRV
jgi:chromate transporter